MNHEVEVSNLMFNKTSEEQIEFKKYDINIDLEEESSNDEKTILKYSLDLTSNPKNSVINISGSTTLSGDQTEIENFLKQENEKTPEVVSLIYQELFPLMYIITKSMKIPAPAHTISQNQGIESNNVENNSFSENDSSMENQSSNINKSKEKLGDTESSSKSEPNSLDEPNNDSPEQEKEQ